MCNSRQVNSTLLQRSACFDEKVQIKMAFYLMNISSPVAPISRLIPFHDFFNRNTCRASSGSLGSVGHGAGGAGKGSTTSCSMISSRPPHDTFFLIFLLAFAPMTKESSWMILSVSWLVNTRTWRTHCRLQIAVVVFQEEQIVFVTIPKCM